MPASSRGRSRWVPGTSRGRRRPEEGGRGALLPEKKLFALHLAIAVLLCCLGELSTHPSALVRSAATEKMASSRPVGAASRAKQRLPVATWSVVSPPRPAPRTLDPLDTPWRKLEAPRPARARRLNRPKSIGAPKLVCRWPAVLTCCVRRPRAGYRSRGRGPQQEQAQERPEERECVPASARQGACPLDRLRLGPGRGAGANFLWCSGQAMMSDARAPTL